MPDFRNCYQFGLWMVVVVLSVLIGASMICREVCLLFMAAWSFIVFIPLLQVLIHRYGVDNATTHKCSCLFWSKESNVAEEEVSYKLNGWVVLPKEREQLKSNGIELDDQDKVDGWYKNNIDKDWYESGCFSFWYAIVRAMLNMYSIFKTASLRLDHDDPGWVGSIWVVSIEVPYMFCLLLPFFFYSVVELGRRFSGRGYFGGRLRPRRGDGLLFFRLSGLLKSLGRFSALNLLEFIRIDEFSRQHKMRKLLSIIGAVIGCMSFRCKIVEIAFIVNRHVFVWTIWQKIRVLALINNLVSIIDIKEKMMVVAIETKYYRKDRWLEAVADHLMSYPPGRLEADPARGSEIIYRVLKRFVSMGLEDVTRLIEDTSDIETSQSDTGAIRENRKIPKQISDDCWNWQLTNIVGVVRFGLFRCLAEKESPSQERQIILQGSVGRVAEAQKAAREKADLEAQVKKLQAQITDPMHTSRH